MKVVSFSLFSHNGDIKTFEKFLEYFSINLRAYKLLFPDWKIHLYLEDKMYEIYKDYFDFLKDNDIIDFKIKKAKTLCENMLWRMETVDFAEYSIARDVDSLPTFRERQSVEVWINDRTMAHAISDNIHHNEVLMGGMIGFKKNAFDKEDMLNTIEYCKENNFITNIKIYIQKIVEKIDFNQKGADQNFLKNYLFNKIYNSITEHRIFGLSKEQIVDIFDNYQQNNFYYDIEDLIIDDVDAIHKQTNKFNYIGKAMQDYTEQETIDIYSYFKNNVNKEFNEKLLNIESQYSEIFKNK
jgi:hypothetical protein